MNVLSRLAWFVLWAGPVIAILLAARQLMQFAQLSSYQAGGYIRALRRLPQKCVWPGLALSAVAVVLMVFGTLALSAPPFLSLVAALLLTGLLLVAGWIIGQMAYREKTAKVKLVMTARIKRLYLATALVAGLICWPMCRAGWSLGFAVLLPVLTPILLLLGLFLAYPVEKAIQLIYCEDARRILEGYRKTGLDVIAITGSYGKTTVKNILAAMLSQRYPTLASPASFNTPLGLARCIREELGHQHRFFIAEMGARHPQDIRVLCRMIRPRAGILTAIGPQHLETMGSLQRVQETKYDLIRALPGDGYAVFNDDGKQVAECFRRTTHLSKCLAGSVDSGAWAEEVKFSAEGSDFVLCFPDGSRQAVSTALAGEHNVRNILMAAAMARQLGISPRKIALALEEVRPIASRLQMSIHPRGYKVINNGFNSNPDSSRKALEVLAAQPGRLVVVTPGFIELGRQETPSNRRLGSDIAAVAHLALLIGEKRTRPIKEGLLENGMRPENILVFAGLNEANRYIQETFGPGDVLLYENDLPDHYA